jgi:hypothetical protein
MLSTLTLTRSLEVMINKTALESIWQNITVNHNYRFTYVKIDRGCNPDLNLGLDKEGNRCLVLVHSDSNSSMLSPATNIRRKNIELFTGDDDEIVLLLKDQLHSELFTELSFALYQKIRNVDQDECALLYVQLVQDWLELFEPTENKGLGVDDVKGLIAELFVLMDQLEGDQDDDVNDVIKWWVGPYNTAKDFCLDDKDIEVKFKNTKASKVTISSEYQLTPEPGKGLELWVISGRVDKEKGVNLTILNNSIKGLIVRKGGSVGGYLKTLQRAGVNHETIGSYDHIMIFLEKLEVYDAILSTFPAIRKTSIPEEISKVKYILNLHSLGAFRSYEKDI